MRVFSATLALCCIATTTWSQSPAVSPARTERAIERDAMTQLLVNKTQERNSTNITLDMDRATAARLQAAVSERQPGAAKTPQAVTVHMRLLRYTFAADGSHVTAIVSSPSVKTLDGMRATVKIVSTDERQAISVLPRLRHGRISLDCDMQVDQTTRGSAGLRMTSGHARGKHDVDQGETRLIAGFTDAGSKAVRRAVSAGNIPSAHVAHTAYYLEVTATSAVSQVRSAPPGSPSANEGINAWE